MKYKIQTLLIIIALFIFGCNDSEHLHILHELNTAILEPVEVTDLTDEAWEKVRIVREEELKYEQVRRNKYLGTANYTEEDQEYYEVVLARAERLKNLQETFYNKHIDADGITIIGNENTLDDHFISARQLVLIATAKRPELRKRYRHSFYIILAGGSKPPIPVIGDSRIVFEGETPTGLCYQNGDSYPGKYQLPELSHNTYILGSGSLSLWDNLTAPQINHEGRWMYVKIGYCWGQVLTGKDHNICTSMTTILHELVHAIIPTMKRYDPTFEDKWNSAYDNAQLNKLWMFSHWSPRVREFHHFMTYVLERFYFEIGSKELLLNKSRYKFKTLDDFIEYDPITAEIILEWFTHAKMQELFSADTAATR